MITIIDYGMGNLHSVSKAVEAAGGDVIVSEKHEDIRAAEKIILPGVGAFGIGMQNLQKLDLIPVLHEEVIEKKKPLLGICLGMQLLAKDSEEHGHHKGLGFIEASVKKFTFPVESKELKVPHVGWNEITIKKLDNPLLTKLPKKPTFYFVHSYYVTCNENIVAATCDYGGEFTAAIWKDNIFATQFHPEKSQQIGLQVLENFIKWKP